MATVPETPPARKPVRAYYAHFQSDAGYLTKAGEHLLFLADGTTAPHVITPDDVCNLAVLGEVGTAVAQYVQDTLAGGFAAICTSRLMEVQ